MNKPVVIWGASGHARVVADILRLNGYSISGFLDDVNQEKHGTAFCDSQILGGHEKLAELRQKGVKLLLKKENEPDPTSYPAR